jgi:hypothetical protein
LVVAIFAVEELRRQPRQFAGVAAWALGAKRPAQPLQQFSAAVVGIKCGSDVKESHSEYLR